mgnify:CR=1 FL=1
MFSIPEKIKPTNKCISSTFIVGLTFYKLLQQQLQLTFIAPLIQNSYFRNKDKNK